MRNGKYCLFLFPTPNTKYGVAMTDNVDEFLNSFSPEIRDIALKLRELVTNLIPDIQEKVYLGWSTISYSFSGGMQDAICAIGPQNDNVNLHFFRGTELDDPDKLLEGEGKQGRHVKLKTIENVDSKSLEKLIKSAAKLEKPKKK
jgi:hypothetical protein